MKKHPLVVLVINIILIMLYQSSLALDQSDVITELSGRSHISAKKIKELLTNCNTPAITQLNMDLCADRDATIAKLKLKKALFNKKLQLPVCKSILDKKMARWVQLRNSGCKNASRIYRGSSIRPFIQTTCIAKETAKMIEKLGSINNCNQLNKILEPLSIKLDALSED